MGIWVNLLKKENLWWKSFFLIMNEALKSCKKTGVKQQEIKELVAVSCKFLQRCLLKIWNAV